MLRSLDISCKPDPSQFHTPPSPGLQEVDGICIKRKLEYVHFLGKNKKCNPAKGGIPAIENIETVSVKAKTGLAFAITPKSAVQKRPLSAACYGVSLCCYTHRQPLSAFVLTALLLLATA